MHYRVLLREIFRYELLSLINKYTQPESSASSSRL
jgi:hypothetical protein